MAINLEYKEDKREAISDMADSLLMVRAVSTMGKQFVEHHTELKEGYHDLQTAFDMIQMLIQPALDYFCWYDDIDPAKKKRKGKKQKGVNHGKEKD